MVRRLFGTTVFIVGLEKSDNGRSCVDNTVCSDILKKAMELCLRHCIVCIFASMEAKKSHNSSTPGIETKIMMDFMLLCWMFSVKTKPRQSVLSTGIWFMKTTDVLKH